MVSMCQAFSRMTNNLLCHLARVLHTIISVELRFHEMMLDAPRFSEF